MGYFSELSGQKVIVTGGNKGIGRHIATAFAGLGVSVVVTGRDETSLAEATEQLRALNPTCAYKVCDVRDVSSIYEMIDWSISRLGGLDIIVNNAGINIAKPALSVTEEDWTEVLDTNLKGAFFCSQRAGRYMTAQRRGRIINIASQMAFVGYHNRAAYCSSKGGVVQLTKALAIEWASYQVKVNAVAPTFVETELTAGMLENKTFKEEVISRIPLGELAGPSDVTGAVLFLASDLAGFITGETIRVDGGWTAI